MNAETPVQFDLREMGPTAEGEIIAGLVYGLFLIVMARGGRQWLIAVGPHVPWRRLRVWLPGVMAVVWAWGGFAICAAVAGVAFWQLLVWVEDLSHPPSLVRLNIQGTIRRQ